jgi:hypothetical protein
LKKRTKKLLLAGGSLNVPRTPNGKGFLVLFFKKEHFVWIYPGDPCAGRSRGTRAFGTRPDLR